jgi:hypothetical protein
MAKVLLGCDPEIFLVYDNKEFISAHEVLPGTKTVPFKVKDGAIQVDGVAAEFNIDPVDNADDFNKNISSVLGQMDEIIKSVDKKISYRCTPIAKFRPDVWSKVPENSKILGCDPDYNVSGEVNINPTEKLEFSTVRTAAGHIHIGFKDEYIENPMDADHFSDCLYIAKGFFHGHLSSYIPRTKEEEERMNYYGHNGSFRPKKYGIELRAPSNWYVGSEEGRKTIFNQTRNHFRSITGL